MVHTCCYGPQEEVQSRKILARFTASCGLQAPYHGPWEISTVFIVAYVGGWNWERYQVAEKASYDDLMAKNDPDLLKNSSM